MLEQAEEQIVMDNEAGSERIKNEYNDVIPDYYTRLRSRTLMKLLKDQWVNGAIDKDVAISTIRVPLLQLSKFSSIKAIEEAKESRQSNYLLLKNLPNWKMLEQPKM